MAAMAFCMASCSGTEAPVDLTQATVVYDGDDTPIAATVLVEEVAKRTGLEWPISSAPGTGTSIFLSLSSENDVPPEGYSAYFGDDGSSVTIEASDSRGLLYGVGYLLRKLDWRQGSASLPASWGEFSEPEYAIRGHEIGHRPLANTYDQWTPEQYEQYIRELALFGINSIQNTHHQLDHPGPMLRVPQMEMHVELSKICQRYGMDYWIWTPITFDLNDAEKHAALLEEHEELYRTAPHLTAVFVPGGDPGENHPSLLMPVMAELAEILDRYHPDAAMWTSLSKFDADKAEYFFNYLQREDPEWLDGIVHQPWSPPFDEVRRRIAERYRFRAFPDETHNCRSQFPVPWWDPALEATLGREASNPRPVHYSLIAKEYLPGTEGPIGYSDGVHDDVNKTIWNAFAWDSEADVRETVVDYSRLFFGPDVAQRAADGILALEQNWYGPLEGNGGVESTLSLWQDLENANPELADNWRWQLLLLRANYDAFVRRKLIHENALERDASTVLANAAELGPEAAMERATAILASADGAGVGADLRERIIQLCDDLFHSIGMQTSVEKYGAHGSERGAVLDFIDVRLSDRTWLEHEMEKVRALGNRRAQIARLELLGNWETPGPGSCYDDVGNVAKSPHVLRGESMITDPTLERTPFPFFWGGGLTNPRHAWVSSIHWPTLVYRMLDPEADYTVRMIANGPLAVRFNGQLVRPSQDSQTRDRFRLYPVPKSLIADGELTITFDDVDEGNIHWRQYSRINEVWLLKQGDGE